MGVSASSEPMKKHFFTNNLNDSVTKSGKVPNTNETPFCDGCKISLEPKTIRMHMDFYMCGDCGRSQDGKPTLLRMKSDTLKSYRVYICSHGERRWKNYTCDLCASKITGINLYQLNYDLCEDCFHGNCLPETKRWTSSFVPAIGKSSRSTFSCDGCTKKDLKKIFLPNFFICGVCSERPMLLSGLLKSLPCRLHRPPIASFTDWLGTDRGDAMGGDRSCHICSEEIPAENSVFSINYGLCQDCVAEPTATVRAQYRGLFKRCVLPGMKKPGWDEMYIPMGEVGSGSFGKVQKVRSASSKMMFAMKVVPLRGMDKMESGYMVTEAEMLLAMKHGNIVEGVEAFLDKAVTLNIVMELGLGDLAGFIKKMAGLNMTVLAWAVLLHVTRGVAYLHALQVLHRDIKPANVIAFMDHGTGLIAFKLVDLGIARPMSDNTYMATSHGTPSYMAPEMMTKEKGSTPASDMWAVGCLIYEVLFGKSPFWDDGDGPVEAYKKMETQLYRIPKGTDPALTAIVRGLLEFNQKKRLTASDVLERFAKEDSINNIQKKIQDFGIET